MTFVFENLPSAVNKVLEEKARVEGRNVQDIALEALMRGLGVKAGTGRRRDLSRFRGTWVEDPEFDKAMKQFEAIDEELWR